MKANKKGKTTVINNSTGTVQGTTQPLNLPYGFSSNSANYAINAITSPYTTTTIPISSSSGVSWSPLSSWVNVLYVFDSIVQLDDYKLTDNIYIQENGKIVAFTIQNSPPINIEEIKRIKTQQKIYKDLYFIDIIDNTVRYAFKKSFPIESLEQKLDDLLKDGEEATIVRENGDIKIVD